MRNELIDYPSIYNKYFSVVLHKHKLWQIPSQQYTCQMSNKKWSLWSRRYVSLQSYELFELNIALST